MSDSKYGRHLPILLDKIIEEFSEIALSEELLLVDCTFGGGGHSCAFLETFPNSYLIACDQDKEAFENGQKILREKGFEKRSHLIHSNFSNLHEQITEVSFFEKFDGKVHGILADLGVSSHQFDKAHRGFSFVHDGPLDMRMNQDLESPTASDIINNYEESELADIFYHYGEERLSRKIAANIVTKRAEKLITRTKELEDIIFHSYPKQQRFGKTHPATRSFQALRIYINNELEIIPESINHLFKLLDSKGIFQVLSFHSLEDRLVKKSFRNLEDEGLAKRVYKKPILPSDEEKLHNSRSRSAKLRVLKKN